MGVTNSGGSLGFLPNLFITRKLSALKISGCTAEAKRARPRAGRAVCGIGARGRVVCPEWLWNTRFMGRRDDKRLFLPVIVFFLAILALGRIARGDEFHLKDGSKIIGTIVSFEDGAFKVQTAYGFALVRKDSIAEIVPTDKKASPDSAPQSPGLKPSAFAATAPSSNPKTLSMPRPIPKYAISAGKPSGTAAAVTNVAPPAIAASSSSPLLPDLSELLHPGEAVDPRTVPMQELVRGNLYVNQTYGFQMYKPPAWQVIKGAQNELPNAIGAMGTEDQSTILVIGRDTMKDSLEAQAAKRERTMREVYENYRPVEKKQISIAGLPAIEQRFYGSLSSHDWSVTVTTLARGNEVFTILGMTSADSDLIQIQENVIAKTIGSLQFLKPQ